MTEQAYPESTPNSIFWVGEAVSPEALGGHCQHVSARGLLTPQCGEFRLIRLQVQPTSHPLHPESVGLMLLQNTSIDWSHWGAALLERFSTTYLVRVLTGSTKAAISEIKNHLISLRFTETEDGRLVQWPWFRSDYFMALCLHSGDSKRRRLFGPIHSVATIQDGVWRCIQSEEIPGKWIDPGKESFAKSEAAVLMQFSMNDYAQALSGFLERNRGELGIKPGVQFNLVCNQAIPLALAQGFYSAELMGLWIILGLVNQAHLVSLNNAEGNQVALLDAALQAGLGGNMLRALSQEFKGWEDIRFPWLSGVSPHTLWDLYAISKLELRQERLAFNSTGVLSPVSLKNQSSESMSWSMSGVLRGALDFQLIDDTGGASGLFGLDELDANLSRYLIKKHLLLERRPQSLHSQESTVGSTQGGTTPLLPAVYNCRLMPTRLNSMPLGHVNPKAHPLVKSLTLINLTNYGLSLSTQSGGYQRLTSTQLPGCLDGVNHLHQQAGLSAHALLDDVVTLPKPASIKWSTCLIEDSVEQQLPKLQNVASTWLKAMGGPDRSRPRDYSKAAVFECREVFPNLDVRAKWALSECASTLNLRLSLNWVWVEDVLLLSAWTRLCGVETCLRIRPSEAIHWSFNRELAIPLESLKPQALVFEERSITPLIVSMETDCLAQQQQMPMQQVHLLNRVCGELQMSCQIVYADTSRNLSLRLMATLSPLRLKLSESQLTLGHRRITHELLPETLLMGVEFDPHG